MTNLPRPQRCLQQRAARRRRPWPAAVPLLFAWLSAAQPAPMLGNTEPVYLRQGTSREIPLQGQNLKDAQKILAPGARGLAATLAPGNERLKLTAAADAPLGEREVRVVTPNGVTAPLIVTVGQFPLIESKATHDPAEPAQLVELPADIVGHIGYPGDAHAFQFVARHGEQLIFDVHAARAGSPLEAVLSVQTAAGTELPRKTEYHGGDPTLVFDVPADGVYVLQVRDLQYRGGPTFHYRIEAGAIPYIEALSPMSGQLGARVEVRALGHNLKDADRIELDLTGASPGVRNVRAHTSQGWSNEVPFRIVDERVLPANPTAGLAPRPTTLPVPSSLSAVLRRQGQEDAYAFHLAGPEQITLAVLARQAGSPLDALLTLKSAGGAVVEQVNSTGDGDPKISRPLDAGDYVATVRDLTSAGGESYAYLLSLDSGAAAQDFTARVLPDAARVARGGNVKLWCDLARENGLRGAVALGIGGLPPGVSAGRVELDEPTSGLFTIAAAANAPLGTFPLHITAMASDGTTHPVAEGVYLTVLPPAPVSIESIAAMGPARAADYEKQAATLAARLAAPNPKVDAAQREWERSVAKLNPIAWTVLNAQALKSTGGATLTLRPDGSILATGPSADRDTYTLTATSDVKGITAIRLEALSDPSLPAGGPGRAVNGNLVVNRFAVTAALTSDARQPTPVAFKAATATFEQANYPIASAAGVQPGPGWALSPELGKNQSAVFTLASPLAPAGGATLNVSIEQSYGAQHVLGRFRLAVSNDPRAGTPATNEPAIPPAVLAIARTPTTQRSALQAGQLNEYYRSISLDLAADHAKLERLRGVGVYAEIATLEAGLIVGPPPADPAASSRRLAELKAQTAPLPLTVARGQLLKLPVPIDRREGFDGDVQVTLEGFSAGRDPATGLPKPIAPNLVVTPLALKGFDTFGRLDIRPTPACELGTRLVVLRADAKIGPDTYTAFSEAFPLTVTEK